MQYVIDYAGSYEGTFAATRSPVRETLYTTRNAALKDLAMVIPGDTEAILKDMVQVKGEEGWYVYLNQEDADADDTGASALALIARAPEGATHKRNPRGKTPLPSEVVPYMSPTKMPKMTSLNREQLEAEGYIVKDLSEEQKEERRSYFLVQSRTLDEALKVLRHYVKEGTKAFIHDRGPGLYNCYVRKTGL